MSNPAERYISGVREAAARVLESWGIQPIAIMGLTQTAEPLPTTSSHHQPDQRVHRNPIHNKGTQETKATPVDKSNRSHQRVVEAQQERRLAQRQAKSRGQGRA